MAAAAATLLWKRLDGDGPPPGFASGNGRIEATEIDIAAKLPGRIREILVAEADFVEAGQVLVRMDVKSLEAELAQAQALARRAQSAKATAAAVAAQRESERVFAQGELTRAEALVAKGFASAQKLEESRARLDVTRAAVGAARSQVLEAQSAIDAAAASVTRLQTEIADATLRAPRSGRVEMRVAQAGEVVAAGAKILTLVDLGDVYMTFFLPETLVGRVAMGAEARLVLDAAPQRPIPARVSFVASEAQFTPKTVETKEERQKLMFRVKAQVEPTLLNRYREQVKTGLPGVAYVRLDPSAPWPAPLQADWATR